MAEKKDFPVFRVGIVTLSDKGYQGEREDKSGPKIKELLPAEQYEVVSMRLLPDERAMIEEELIRLADLEQCDLVLTTGGTGFSMRDVTPEATLRYPAVWHLASRRRSARAAWRSQNGRC